MERSRYDTQQIAQRLPLKTVAVYALFGCLWILFSDTLLEAMITNTETLVRLAMYKGWFYVLITALLLYRLMRNDLLKIQRLNESLVQKNAELSASNEEIQALYQQVSASEQLLRTNFDELRTYQARLEEEERRYRLVLAASQEGIWDYDVPTGALQVSEAFLRNLGYEPEDPGFLPESLLEQVHPEDRKALRWIFGETVPDDLQNPRVEVRVRHRGGEYRWMRFHGIVVRSPEGDCTRVVGAMADIHERFLQQEKIAHYAFHDASTGFLNRDYLLERLGSRTRTERPVRLLSVGIQGFGRLTSIYGNLISEMLHYQTGMLIHECFGHPERLAVLNRGRFALLLPEESTGEDLNRLIEVLNDRASEPFQVNQVTLAVQLAYGATEQEPSGVDAEALITQAETALDSALASGTRATATWFHESMLEQKRRSGQIQAALSNAVDQRELRLVYQPQYAPVVSGKPIGYEALIRWNSASVGMVPPDIFIPMAESTGQIERIGRFVLDRTCRFLNTLKDQGAPEARISINASLVEVVDSAYVNRLNHMVDQFGLTPERLRIEITETAVAKYFDAVQANLKSLRQSGYEIHLDDFGTGYASLSYLGHLPVSTLKIDRSFVWQLETDGRMQEVTRLIIDTGHRLGMTIVAEGVETEPQYQLLHQMGCDQYQGYLFSKPLEEEALLSQIHQDHDIRTVLKR